MQQFTYDALVRHQIMLERRANGVLMGMLGNLSALIAGLSASLLNGSGASAREEAGNLIERELDEVVKQIEFEISDLTNYEIAFTGALLAALLQKHEVKYVLSITVLDAVNSTPLQIGDQPMMYQQMLAQFKEVNRRQLRSVIQSGRLGGKSSGDIARELDRVIRNRTQQQAKAVIRTGTNHATGIARKAMYDANAEIFKHEQWVSVLDTRTSAVCRARSGRIYPIGQGDYPPAHFNCRSLRVPVVLDKYVKPEHRQFVPQTENYQSWLMRQPESVQNEVLGITRAKLFRDGGLTVDKFVSESGKTYTLRELQALEPVAFAKI